MRKASEAVIFDSVIVGFVCVCGTVWDGMSVFKRIRDREREREAADGPEPRMEVVDLEHLGEQELFSLVTRKPNEVRTHRQTRNVGGPHTVRLLFPGPCNTPFAGPHCMTLCAYMDMEICLVDGRFSSL